MSALRRSTRLSSIGQAEKPSTPQRTKIWLRRQTKKAISSDDEQAEEHTLVESVSSEENNENRNVMNKIEYNRKKKPILSTKTVMEPTTPRSSKGSKVASTRNRPMSACKKIEKLTKRKAQVDDSSDSDEDEKPQQDQHVSPPKQARHQQKPMAQHLISPTRLLDRLSIDEHDENRSSEATDNEEPEKPSVSSPPRNKYQNARRVLNSAETKNLPGREQQLLELDNFFTEHLKDQRSGSLYVSGQPGTGKTACLSLLLRSPKFTKQLQHVYINCTSIASTGGVYKKICSELQLHPAGRNERDCLAAILQHLRTARRMLLIVLDEIDQLCNSKQSVLYTIFEWPALPGAKLLLVGIANSLDLTDRALIRLNARCELKPRLMHFAPYSKQQIVDIFRARLEEADVLDVFPPVTLQLLAAKVSAVSGDVRRALDIGRRVVEIAEQQKKAGEREVKLNGLDIELDSKEETLKPVQVTQVAAVLNKVYGASQNLQEDIEESFPLQQKIMLCSLMLMLRKERNKDINIGRLHEVYRRVCNKRHILPLDQAEFAGLVDLVETRGILRIMHKKEPRLNKVLLQWDEEEVNGALSDKQLIASILDDTACLAGGYK